MFVLWLCLFFWLLVGHAFVDYSWQTDFIAVGKNRNLNDGSKGIPWYYIMSAHALMHGGAVGLLSGWIVLGALETVLHFVIDYAKCEKWINFHQDQLAHVLCKAAWAFAAAYVMTMAV